MLPGWPCLDQPTRSLGGDQVYAAQVGGQRLLPIRLGHFFQPAAPTDAGVIDHDIDGAVFSLTGVERGGNAF